MRKLSFFIFGIVLSFAFAFCGYGVVTAAAEETMVYVGGMSAGFTLKSGDIQILGTCDVMTENGVFSPALESGLRAGDKMISLDGIKVENIANLNDLMDKLQGKKSKVNIVRGKETLEFEIQPVKDRLTNHYKMGILARDNVSGIGTVTYITEKSRRFGALGHTVIDSEKKELKISDGGVYACNIVGIRKGVRGKAGELRGMFLNNKAFGKAEKLCDCGIFGRVFDDFDCKGLIKTVASSENVTPGNAYIYSTVNGESPVKYQIEVVKVDKNNRENKNYVIKVTDEDLISQTGGIV